MEKHVDKSGKTIRVLVLLSASGPLLMGIGRLLASPALNGLISSEIMVAVIANTMKSKQKIRKDCIWQNPSSTFCQHRSFRRYFFPEAATTFYFDLSGSIMVSIYLVWSEVKLIADRKSEEKGR